MLDYRNYICATDNIPHRIFAALSKNVYGIKKSIESGWNEVSNSNKVNNNPGYYGAAYMNTARDTIIIAHRGTETTDIKDIYADWQLIAQKTLDQYHHAKLFFDMIKKEYPGKAIIHTGHSLGAVLAEMLACMHQHDAVTFDSPGSLNQIEILAKSQGLNPKKLIQQCSIVSYLSEPNIINTLHGHVGVSYRLFIQPLNKDVSGDNYIRKIVKTTLMQSLGWIFPITSEGVEEAGAIVNRLLSQHSIENIYSAFGDDVCPADMALVQNWPVGLSGAMAYYSYAVNGTKGSYEYVKNYSNDQELSNHFERISYDVIGVEEAIIYNSLLYPFRKEFLKSLSSTCLMTAFFQLLGAAKFNNLQKIIPFILVASSYASDPYGTVLKGIMAPMLNHFCPNKWWKPYLLSLSMSFFASGCNSYMNNKNNMPNAFNLMKFFSSSMGGCFGAGLVTLIVDKFPRACSKLPVLKTVQNKVLGFFSNDNDSILETETENAYDVETQEQSISYKKFQ